MKTPSQHFRRVDACRCGSDDRAEQDQDPNDPIIPGTFLSETMETPLPNIVL